MFYEAVAADDSRTIGVAVSKDGVKSWKCADAPVLSASTTGSWDSGDVGAPCAVSMEGEISDLRSSSASEHRARKHQYLDRH